MSKKTFIHSWPRLMKAHDAATYIGTSTTHLRRLVERGELAHPLKRGGERLWDIKDLDAHADNLAKDSPVDDAWLGTAL